MYDSKLMFLSQCFLNARFLYFTHFYMYGQFKPKIAKYWLLSANNVIYFKFWQSS